MWRGGQRIVSTYCIFSRYFQSHLILPPRLWSSFTIAWTAFFGICMCRASRLPRLQNAWKIPHTYCLPHTIHPINPWCPTIPPFAALLPKITTMSETDGQDSNNNSGPSNGSAPAVASPSQAEMAQVSEQAALSGPVWNMQARTIYRKANYIHQFIPALSQERG